jgi:hypothetical protein
MKRFYFYCLIIFEAALAGLILSCSNAFSSNFEDFVAFKEKNAEVTDVVGTSDQNVPIDVIILAGQSNATGLGYNYQLVSYISEEFFEAFSTGCPNTNIIGYTNWAVRQDDDVYIPLSKVRFGLGADNSQFGLELGLAYVGEMNKATTLIIKYTSPGNFIDFFINGESITPHFESFIKNSLQQIKNNGYDPTLKAVCWMQGESDSVYPEMAENYESKEKILISSIREKFGQNIVFVDAAITDMDLIYPVNYQSTINEAKRHICESDDRNYMIDSSGLTKSTEDNIHYDARSEFEIGVRMGVILQNIN